MTEDEMVGWHPQLNGHGFGWTLGVGDGQGGLACCGSWGRKESNTILILIGSGGKESACQCKRHRRVGFDPWVGKIPQEKGMATHSSTLA